MMPSESFFLFVLQSWITRPPRSNRSGTSFILGLFYIPLSNRRGSAGPEKGCLVVEAGYEQGHCSKLPLERPSHLTRHARGFVTNDSLEHPLLASDATCPSVQVILS